jgi:CheY-like chemotaxis protein
MINALHVLLVEDDIINQKLASRFLIQCGMDVTIANGGKEALELIRAKHYSFVLMDMQMPDMDGCETATHIRALDDPYYKTVPILAFTSSDTDDIKQKASRHGMNGFLSKPLDTTEMMKKINQYII